MKLSTRATISLATPFAVLLAIALARPAVAGLDEGKAAFERGDYETAMRELLPLAEQGVSEAQLGVGVMYANGQGVAQNPADAAKWFREAAEQGHAQAQFNLASMYSVGRGVAQDNVLAYMWCTVSANSTPAGEMRDRAAQRCDRLAPRLSSRELAKAKELASKFVPRSERP